MFSPPRCRTSKFCFILTLSICLCLFFGEWLQPNLCLQTWPELSAPSMENDQEVRLLLVADTHVQVYHSPFYYLEWIAIADSDWYLKRYFHQALVQINPSAVIFLGDLVEEGSTTSSEALNHAFDRFERIFMDSNPNLPTFLVPGDNDVGGAWDDPLTEAKMERFRSHFVSYPRTRRVGFVQLFPDPLNTKWISPPFDSFQSDAISVYVSHVPMVTPYGMDPSPSLVRSEPSLLINGHDHVGYVLEWKKNGSNPEHIGWLVKSEASQLYRSGFETVLNGSLHKLTNDPQGRLVQFGVPSCSYRSGHAHLAAYGLARIYRNRTVTYRLLPLPDRSITCLFYAFVIASFCLWQLVRSKWLRCRRTMLICLFLGVILLSMIWLFL